MERIHSVLGEVWQLDAEDASRPTSGGAAKSAEVALGGGFGHTPRGAIASWGGSRLPRRGGELAQPLASSGHLGGGVGRISVSPCLREQILVCSMPRCHAPLIPAPDSEQHVRNLFQMRLVGSGPGNFHSGRAEACPAGDGGMHRAWSRQSLP